MVDFLWLLWCLLARCLLHTDPHSASHDRSGKTALAACNGLLLDLLHDLLVMGRMGTNGVSEPGSRNSFHAGRPSFETSHVCSPLLARGGRRAASVDRKST